MSTLHSFYCWGSVAVVLLSTAFFAVFGLQNWKWLACLWALVPLYNTFNFAFCPIERLVEQGESMTISGLLRKSVFLLAIVLMICAGASELSMAQWASAFAEKALGLTKTVGDLLGPCLFAVTMGISRTLYGRYAEKLKLERFMFASAAMCLCCYLLACFAQLPVFGLIGCVMCGFSVGIMWPGTISICSGKLPTGGTAMFALLAMAGDIGGALGPALVGRLAQQAGDDLSIGLRIGCVFPIVLIVALFVMTRMDRKTKS